MKADRCYSLESETGYTVIVNVGDISPFNLPLDWLKAWFSGKYNNCTISYRVAIDRQSVNTLIVLYIDAPISSNLRIRDGKNCVHLEWDRDLNIQILFGTLKLICYSQ